MAAQETATHGAVEIIAGTVCALGESPVWDEARSRLVWTDIQGKAIHTLSWPDRTHGVIAMPKRVGALGLCASGRLILGFEDEIALWDEATGSFTSLCMIEADNPHTRLNDGKVGPDGAFWIGSMDERPDRQPIGTLWRVTADGKAEAKVGGLKVSNGLAWSPDGLTMFHADSRAEWIDIWDCDPTTGDIGNRRRIATPDNPTGRPDGAACDRDGVYWSAGVSASRLNMWSRDGRLIGSIALPLPSPTMPCFGGPGLRTLFVTSHREAPEAKDNPVAGSLMVLPAVVAGAPVHRFRDKG
jgi:sugar lactone lactonase YvrE